MPSCSWSPTADTSGAVIEVNLAMSQTRLTPYEAEPHAHPAVVYPEIPRAALFTLDR